MSNLIPLKDVLNSLIEEGFFNGKIDIDEEMRNIMKLHINEIPKRSVVPIVNGPSETEKPVLHKVKVIGIKDTNEKIDITLSIKAYRLDYGPTIMYEVISNVPYIGEWKEHPFKDVELDDYTGNIQSANYIDDTPATSTIIEDLISNLEPYTKTSIKNEDVNLEKIKTIIVNKVVTIISFQEINFCQTKEIPIMMKVTAFQLMNGQIALKIATNISNKGNWSIHPFRYLNSKKAVSKIVGMLPDTPGIRQIINDLTNESEFKLFTTYDGDYRASLINNLHSMFITKETKQKDKSPCLVARDLIKSLHSHWS